MASIIRLSARADQRIYDRPGFFVTKDRRIKLPIRD
jgi:hypothetical protein